MMKEKTPQDPLFEAFEKAFPVPNITKGHQQRFTAKLKEPTRVQPPFQQLKIAVVALLCIGLGSLGTLYFSSKNDVPTKFYQAETYFTSAITTTLEEAERLSNPETAALVADAKIQLQRLQKDYIQLQELFQERNAHPKLLNAMISNLEYQLTLARELKQLISAFKTPTDETELL
jgi:hypothetical protein